ncbi:hypothetical protein ACMFMG_006238 [Clarireedia jacksonii]
MSSGSGEIPIREGRRKRTPSLASHEESQSHSQSHKKPKNSDTETKNSRRPRSHSPSSSTSKGSATTAKCLGHRPTGNIHDDLENGFRKCGPCEFVQDLWRRGATFKNKHFLLDDELRGKGDTMKMDFLMNICKAKFSDINSTLETLIRNEEDTIEEIKEKADFLIRHGAEFPDILGLIMKQFKHHLNEMKKFKLRNVPILPASPKIDYLVRQLDQSVTSEQVEELVKNKLEECGNSSPALDILIEKFASPKLIESYVGQCRHAIHAAEIYPDLIDKPRSEDGMFRPQIWVPFGTNIPEISTRLLMEHFPETFEIYSSKGKALKLNKKIMQIRSDYFKGLLKNTDTSKNADTSKNIDKAKNAGKPKTSGKQKNDGKGPFKKLSDERLPESWRVLEFVKRYAETTSLYFDWKPVFLIRGEIPLEKAGGEELAGCLDNLLDIMVAADRFLMEDLLNDVQNHILKYAHYLIQASNVKEVKEIAKEHRACALAKYCRVFMSHKRNMVDN